MKKIWYKQEAKKWEEAFPLGNGSIGGMFFCGMGFDRIGISADTIWSGTKFDGCEHYDKDKFKEVQELIDLGKYDIANKKLSEKMTDYFPQTFLTAGSIYIDMQGWRQGTTDKKEISEIGEESGQNKYTRSLSLETAVLDCSYEFDGINVKKQAFISNPDNVMVYNIELDNKSDFMIYPSCPLKHTIKTRNNEILLEGVCPSIANKDLGNVVSYDNDDETIHFAERTRIVTDGNLYSSGAAVYVTCATKITLYLTVATSFAGYDKRPVAEYLNKSATILDAAMSRTYDELLQRHIHDYSHLFSRSNISIGHDNGKPTDEQIKNPHDDENLAELLFDFGKYLMIAGSRQGTQPANLQGIWNDTVIPPFHSSYTVNINLQMNYWAAEVCNLTECHEPMLKYIADASKTGHSISQKGWNFWHCTDIWHYPYEVTKMTRCGFWPMGGVWCCRHIWERYLFTMDKEFLRENIGVLRGACEFVRDWSISEAGRLITNPSTSPENAFIYNETVCGAAKACSMDLQLMKEVCTYTAEAMDIIGEDGNEYKKLADMVGELKIGSDGRLLEWGEELEESEKGHRHLSHLYGVYPSDSIKENTELYDAAKKSLEVRMENGSGYTGWSNAWVLNLYARFKDSENAHKRIISFFCNSVYPNMFDKHPPFQIDGNFGMCAGIAEMLLQSHTEYCELMPAVPKEWREGSVTGLKARGGYTVGFKWKDGEITEYDVKDRFGNKIDVSGNKFLIKEAAAG